MKKIDPKILEIIKKINAVYVKHARALHVLQVLHDSLVLSAVTAEPESVMLTGAAGSGKSTVLGWHRDGFPTTKGRESAVMPIVYAEIPDNANPKAVLEEFVKQMGGTITRQTTRDLHRAMKKLAPELQVRQFILDEVQHLFEHCKPAVIRAVADTLKTVINNTGLPMVLTGVPEATALLLANDQLDGRIKHRVQLLPFSWEDQGKELCKFLRAIGTALPFPVAFALDDHHVAARILLATEGNMRQMMTLIRQAAQAAARADRRGLADDLLSDAAARHCTAVIRTGVNPWTLKDKIVDEAVDALTKATAETRTAEQSDARLRAKAVKTGRTA